MHYIKSLDEGYDSKGAIFNGYIYEKDIPVFIMLNGSQFRKSCHFKHQIIEYRGNNCFILTEKTLFF